MNVVDSSGWIEVFDAGRNAHFFQPALKNPDELIVPSISIYEVYRCILRKRGADAADAALAAMSTGRVVDLNIELATSSAILAHENKLALADAIILATAQRFAATLWTQDADLKDFENIQYIARKSSEGN